MNCVKGFTIKFAKFLHRNANFLFCILLLFIILFLAINPEPIISATFKGLSVWAKIVLPSLFCFFIFTKILMQQKETFKIFHLSDRLLGKMFNVRNFAGYTFFVSIITGYPLGAKLISEFYEEKLVTKSDAKKMIAFCSTSGPMFIIGSVAVGLFSNFSLGIGICFCHFFSAFLNGILFRNINRKKSEQRSFLKEKMTIDYKNSIKIHKHTLNEIMFNTIISVLMIGGYITLCFSLLEFVTGSKLFEIINSFLKNFFGSNIFESLFNGFVEVTNGMVSLAQNGFSQGVLLVAASSLISFGGLSIHLQSHFFLSKIGISYRYFLLTKITHTLIAFGLSLVVCIVFF